MAEPNAQKLVIFNVFGHLNMGDAMLVEALTDILREHFAHATLAGLATDVTSQERWMPEIDWSARVATKAGLGRPLGLIVQAIHLPIAIAIASSKSLFFLRHLLPRRQRQGLEALAEADIAISCPGGYLEDSNHAYLLNMLQIALALRLSKRVILAPQSIGPVRSQIGRRLIGSILKRVDRVFVREQSSCKFMTELNDDALPPNVEMSGDLAFWYKRAPIDIAAEWKALGVDPSKPILGMTILSWNFPHSPDPDNARRAYLESLSCLVDRACDDGYQVVIFNQVASDLATVDMFASINARATIDRGERDCGKLAAMIGQCELFIGSRFHSCIFGLIGSRPTGALAYLPKTSGIMKDLGLSDYVISMDEITPEQVIALYESLRANVSVVSEEVAAAVSEYRRSNDSFGTFLARLSRAEA